MFSFIIAIIALIIGAISIILILILNNNIKNIVRQMNEFNRNEYNAIQRNAKDIEELRMIIKK